MPVKVGEWFPPRPRRQPKQAQPKILTAEQRAAQRWYNHQRTQRPFIPVRETFDDVDAWQVCYGQLHHVARLIASQFPYESERQAFLAGKWSDLPWGKLQLHPDKVHDEYISGGALYYNGHRIFDVRPFFMQSLQRTAAAYGTTDVVEIMNRARDDLATVGLSADQNDWYRNSALVGAMLRNMNVQGAVTRINPPYPRWPAEQHTGLHACGYIPGPVYEYDMVSAFASRLLVFPELRDYVTELDRIRRELTGAPSAHLIKVAQAVLPGKLLARHGTTKYVNEHLGIYIRAETRRMLDKAMDLASDSGGKIFRWYIDGFYTDVDLGDEILGVPLDGRLGNWRKTIHDYMLIGGISIFKTNLKMRTNGYHNLDWDRIREDPLRFYVTRRQVDWARSLKEKQSQVLTEFEGGYHQCDGFHACHDEIHYTREGAAQWLP